MPRYQAEVVGTAWRIKNLDAADDHEAVKKAERFALDQLYRGYRKVALREILGDGKRRKIYEWTSRPRKSGDYKDSGE